MRDNAGAYRGWSIAGTTWRKRRNLESVVSFIEIYSIDSSKLIHKHALSRTPRRRVNGQWFALIGRRKQVTSRDELKHGISIRMYTFGAVLLNKNNSLHTLILRFLQCTTSAFSLAMDVSNGDALPHLARRLLGRESGDRRRLGHQVTWK